MPVSTCALTFDSTSGRKTGAAMALPVQIATDISCLGKLLPKSLQGSWAVADKVRVPRLAIVRISADLVSSPALRVYSASGSVLLSTSSDRVCKLSLWTDVTGYSVHKRHPRTTKVGTGRDLTGVLLQHIHSLVNTLSFKPLLLHQ